MKNCCGDSIRYVPTTLHLTRAQESRAFAEEPFFCGEMRTVYQSIEGTFSGNWRYRTMLSRKHHTSVWPKQALQESTLLRRAGSQGLTLGQTGFDRTMKSTLRMLWLSQIALDPQTLKCARLFAAFR